MSIDLFKRAIPGQSLTGSIGSAPHENPPQYADVNDALEHIFNALTDPRQVTRLILMLKKGIPAEFIARSVIMAGFGKGMWNPDVGMLMLRTVVAMIIGIAHLKGVKATIFNPDKEQNDFLDKFLDLASEDTNESSAAPTQAAPQFSGVLGGNL